MNLFKCKDAPEPWDVSNLYQEETDDQIVEYIAEFFNRISQEYVSIPNPRVIEEAEVEPILEQYIVASRIKSFKKPKSQVRGDIPPDLVNQFYDQLAVPLTFIYNQALTFLEWPDLWKAETVSVITEK